MVRSAALTVGALLTSAGVAPAQVHPPAAAADTAPLIERSHRGTVIHGLRILARFPQITAFDVDGCRFTAFLSDTTAAVPVRRAFLPLMAAADPRCDAEVIVVPFVTRDELESALSRLRALLEGTDTGARVYFNVRRGKIVVEVKNVPSEARAEARIVADQGLLRDLIVIEARARRREAEDAEPAPPHAYFPVLNHIYRQWLESGLRLGLRPHNLPGGFAREHLHSLPIRITDDPCETQVWIQFMPARQLEDGAFWLEVFAARPNSITSPTNYNVRCANGECFIVDIEPLTTDLASHSCR